MSGQDGFDAELVAAYGSMMAVSYCAVAVSALGAYEYILTLRDEWSIIWHRKWTASTWLLVANRAAEMIFILVTLIPSTAQTCSGAMYAVDTIDSLIPYLIMAAFSTLRVYALAERNLMIALSVAILSMVPFATNLYRRIMQVSSLVLYPILGPVCVEPSLISPSLDAACALIISSEMSMSQSVLLVAIFTRASVIVADAIVVVVTWRKTYRHYREASRFSMHTGVSATLLRDGSIYFIILLLLNITQLLLNVVPGFDSKLSSLSTFTTVVDFVVISRFIINLQRANQPESTNGTAGDFSKSSILNFRNPTIVSIVGDMGRPLDHGPREEEVDTWETETVPQESASTDDIERGDAEA